MEQPIKMEKTKTWGGNVEFAGENANNLFFYIFKGIVLFYLASALAFQIIGRSN